MVKNLRTGCAAAAVAGTLLAVMAACVPGQAKPSGNPSASGQSPAAEHFDAQNFSTPTKVTNQYYPLIQGTRTTSAGTRKGVSTRVEIVVTNDTKTVAGVPAVVVSDRVYEAGQLVEDTVDWFAQDNQGNVWYFGEYATAYQAGRSPDHSGSWEAGTGGSQPGIVMPASPQPGRTYQQEHAAGVAEDMAKVLKLDDSLCVPYQCFRGNLLVTEEWSRLSPGEVQHKYYAPGVGNVRTQTVKGDPEQVDLVSVQRPG